jgi:hypothetical protein
MIKLCAGGCLSSAKLRSTDSVNPRAVLSRVRPRYRLYSKHRDRRCWTGPGIGIRVSFRTLEESQIFRTTKEQRRRAAIRDQPFAPPYRRLSKAALSGPSVCLRARAPCPLRVSCLRIVLPDRVGCRPAFRWLLGTRHCLGQLLRLIATGSSPPQASSFHSVSGRPAIPRRLRAKPPQAPAPFGERPSEKNM